MGRPRSPKNTERQGDQPTRDEEKEVNKVARPLADGDIEKRRSQLATLSLEVLDLEDERTATNKEINSTLKEKKAAIRKLAVEIKTKQEMIPAQLALADAIDARRSAERGKGQDTGAPVNAPLKAVEP